jgi:3-hydroxymyristoyl/3-hydroxydecanoyl-(acyl carrier protein) dehydratase
MVILDFFSDDLLFDLFRKLIIVALIGAHDNRIKSTRIQEPYFTGHFYNLPCSIFAAKALVV